MRIVYSLLFWTAISLVIKETFAIKTYFDLLPYDMQNELLKFHNPYQRVVENFSISIQHSNQEKQTYYERKKIAPVPLGYFNWFITLNNDELLIATKAYPSGTNMKIFSDNRAYMLYYGSHSLDANIVDIKNNKVLTHCRDTGVFIWVLGEETFSAMIPGTNIHAAHFNKDASKLIATNWDQESHIWSLNPLKKIASFHHSHTQSWHEAFFNEPEDLILVINDNQMQIRDVKKNIAICGIDMAYAISASWNNKGDSIIIFSPFRAQVWNVPNPQMTVELSLQKSLITRAVFLPMDDKVAIHSEDSFSIWDLLHKTQLCVYPFKEGISQLLINHDSSKIFLRNPIEIYEMNLQNKNIYQALMMPNKVTRALSIIKLYERYVDSLRESKRLHSFIGYIEQKNLENKLKKYPPAMQLYLQQILKKT